MSARSSPWRLWPATLLALLPVALPAPSAGYRGPVILPSRPVLCPAFPPPPLVILAPLSRPIRFEVWLPADAQLWISGARTSATGEFRAFQTPPVTVGCEYGYTLTATCGDQTVTWNVLLRHSDPAQVFDLRPSFAKSSACQRIPLDVDTPSATYPLREWKFLAGTESLAWLKTHEAYRQDFECQRVNVLGEKQEEPEALVLRQADYLYYARGVQTLLPLNRVAGVAYDDTKQTVTVHSLPPGLPASGDKGITAARGTTAYKDINKVKLEGRTENDNRALTFLGGYSKVGSALAIRGLRFAMPREVPALPDGVIGTVRYAAGPYHYEAKVADLLPIYLRGSKGKELRTTLFFADRLELDVGRVRWMRRPDRKLAAGGAAVGVGLATVGVGGLVIPGLANGTFANALSLGVLNADTRDEDTWHVRTWKGGLDGQRRLHPSASHQGEHVSLLGFVGRAQGRYSFFPTDVVTEVRFRLTEPVAAP